MFTKKTILALALVLVIAVIAVVCVSCAKKEKEYKQEQVSFTFVNQTGKNVTEIVLDDRRSENKMTAKPEEGGLPTGQSYGFSMMAAIENGAPDLMFSYTVEGGDNISASVTQKEGTITMVTREDGISFSISDPAAK